MAYFHSRLKYHEDVTPKHLITDDEIAFLLELQKEMNTQDNVGQADPRFWVIKGSTKEYGIDDGYEDGCVLVDDSDEIAARDIESLFQHLLDNKYNGILELEDAKTIKMIDKKIEIKWKDKTETITSLEDAYEWFCDMGYSYRLENYRVKSIIYPDLLFLTQKAAENHLRANHYHYSDDAHTYAMTSWRNPETEKLWNILRKVDWEILKKMREFA